MPTLHLEQQGAFFFKNKSFYIVPQPTYSMSSMATPSSFDLQPQNIKSDHPLSPQRMKYQQTLFAIDNSSVNYSKSAIKNITSDL